MTVDIRDVGPLEHGRVRLVPMSLAHVGGLAIAATSDRSTYGLAPVPFDRPSTERYVARALADKEALRAVPFVVELAGAIVGSYRLMSLEWWTWPEGAIQVPGEPRIAPAPPDVAEIGHAWITPAVQRSPLNTTVCMLLMRHAFDVWGVHRLVLKTDARNTRSRNAITRLGGSFEGIMRAHTPAADGGIRDVALFSVLPAEWPEVRKRLESTLSTPHTS